MKKSKKIKIISASVFSTIFIGGSLTGGLVVGSQNQANITKVASTTNADENNLVASETNFQTKNISTNSGPVTFWGSTINGIYWYGQSRWTLDTKSYLLGINSNYSQFSTGNYWTRYWYDWDYDSTNDVLWILGAWNVNKKKYGNQILFKVDNKNGKTLGYWSIPQSTVAYRNIKVLSSGTVLLWNGPNYAVTRTAWQAAKFDPSTQTFNVFHGNVGNYVPKDSQYSTSKYPKSIWQLNNIIPIADNLNILVSVHGVDSATQKIDGSGTSSLATYDAYGYLVDDSLNLVSSDSVTMNGTKQTTNYFLISNGLSGFTNSATSPQKEYYTLLNGMQNTQTFRTLINIIKQVCLSDKK